MTIWVTFHNDSQVGEVTDVRTWSSEEKAEEYINMPENGGVICGWEVVETIAE